MMNSLIPDTFAFQIECVSPTLNLGADKQPEDEIFRAASLRGCWRFWARAAIAGLLEKPNRDNPDTLRLLESCLFGGVEPPFQAFRMRVSSCQSQTPAHRTFLILPHKDPPKNPKEKDQRAPKKGNCPGPDSTAEVRISLNQTVYPVDQARKALLAAIWLWGNLGGIGTRSRRGFGSVALLPDENGYDPFAAAGLPKCCETFASRNALVEHLQTGIACAFQIIREWIAVKYKTKKSIDQKRGATEDMFILSSLAQVFVGEMFQSCNDLLRIIADKKAI